MSRATQSSERIHERARTLAAQAIDAQLEAFEATWLAEHLSGCGECRQVADEYRAIHDELRSLPLPQPPRDLWARTSAALDAVDRGAASPSRGWLPGRLAFDRPLGGSAFAVALVVVIAAVSLVTQGPLSLPFGGGPAGSASPGSAPEMVAFREGTGIYLTGQGDQYEFKARSADCPAGAADSCSVTTSGGATLGTIRSRTPVSASLSPDARQAAIWTDSKVVILPLGQTAPATISIDDLTPRPVATAGPSAPVQSPTLPSPSEPLATPTPTQSIEPGSTESASPGAVETATPTAAPSPTPAPTSAPVAGQPIAILDGYEIVGHDPAFSADGYWLAFAARPADHSAGPDVFVWRVGLERALTVTTAHADLFSGWFGQRILLSEFGAAGGAGSSVVTSYVFEPQTGACEKIVQPMLLPVVDPTGSYVVYWTGSVQLDAATGLWEPGSGNLYFDSWFALTLEPASLAGTRPSPAPTPSQIPSPSPTASPEVVPTAEGSALPEAAQDGEASPDQQPAGQPEQTESPEAQLLPVSSVPGGVTRWLVHWDSGGEHLAVWVADPATPDVGTVSLFAVDRSGGRVVTDPPLLAVGNVLASIQFDDGRLVYTSNADGKTYLVAVPQVAPTPTSATTSEASQEASPTAESSGDTTL